MIRDEMTEIIMFLFLVASVISEQPKISKQNLINTLDVFVSILSSGYNSLSFINKFKYVSKESYDKFFNSLDSYANVNGNTLLQQKMGKDSFQQFNSIINLIFPDKTAIFSISKDIDEAKKAFEYLKANSSEYERLEKFFGQDHKAVEKMINDLSTKLGSYTNGEIFTTLNLSFPNEYDILSKNTRQLLNDKEGISLISYLSVFDNQHKSELKALSDSLFNSKESLTTAKLSKLLDSVILSASSASNWLKTWWIHIQNGFLEPLASIFDLSKFEIIARTHNIYDFFNETMVKSSFWSKYKFPFEKLFGPISVWEKVLNDLMESKLILEPYISKFLGISKEQFQSIFINLPILIESESSLKDVIINIFPENKYVDLYNQLLELILSNSTKIDDIVDKIAMVYGDSFKQKYVSILDSMKDLTTQPLSSNSLFDKTVQELVIKLLGELKSNSNNLSVSFAKLTYQILTISQKNLSFETFLTRVTSISKELSDWDHDWKKPGEIYFTLFKDISPFLDSLSKVLFDGKKYIKVHGFITNLNNLIKKEKITFNEIMKEFYPEQSKIYLEILTGLFKLASNDTLLDYKSIQTISCIPVKFINIPETMKEFGTIETNAKLEYIISIIKTDLKFGIIDKLNNMRERIERKELSIGYVFNQTLGIDYESFFDAIETSLSYNLIQKISLDWGIDFVTHTQMVQDLFEKIRTEIGMDDIQVFYEDFYQGAIPTHPPIDVTTSSPPNPDDSSSGNSLYDYSQMFIMVAMIVLLVVAIVLLYTKCKKRNQGNIPHASGYRSRNDLLVISEDPEWENQENTNNQNV